MNRKPSGRTRSTEPQQAAKAPPPLEPRPKLLMGLSVVYALWLGALLVLYFTTVYPQRNSTTQPAGTGVTATRTH